MLATIVSILTSPLLSALAPSIGELGLAIALGIIQRNANNVELKQSFLDRVQALESSGSVPAGLYGKYSNLLNSVDSKIDADLAKEKAQAQTAPISAEKFISNPEQPKQ